MIRFFLFLLVGVGASDSLLYGQRSFHRRPSQTTPPVYRYAKRPHVVVERSLQTYHEKVKKNPQMQLIDLGQTIPEVVIDLRYGSSHNFLEEKLYPSQARAFLRKAAADRLALVQKELQEKGLGLKIWDAYRPWSVTKKMWELRPQKKVSSYYLAPPAVGSQHNRGVAVDVTLVNLQTGKELLMPTPWDDFSPRAFSAYPNVSEEVKANRATLQQVMRRHGFSSILREWWHFELKEAGRYPVMDLSFEELVEK